MRDKSSCPAERVVERRGRSHLGAVTNDAGDWVPTDPARQLELMFRAYAPTKPLFEKTWGLRRPP
jgi:hypothetical protein